MFQGSECLRPNVYCGLYKGNVLLLFTLICCHLFPIQTGDFTLVVFFRGKTMISCWLRFIFFLAIHHLCYSFVLVIMLKEHSCLFEMEMEKHVSYCGMQVPVQNPLHMTHIQNQLLLPRRMERLDRGLRQK